MNYPLDLQVVWFILVGVLLTGYALLDGFDLGVGALHLFSKGDQERRIMLNSIGPVWDGNEVWLLVGGGALFAAFPQVYATVFSGFYLPLYLLLLGIIFRAVAIEFRSKVDSPKWRQGWDVAFSVASILIPILMGVALGNIIIGIPIDGAHVYQGGFFNLLMPYPLIIGITTLAVFMLHGAIYVVMKTDGEMQARAKTWVWGTMIFCFIMYALATIGTFIFAPQMADVIRTNPWLILLPIANVLALANVPRMIYHKKETLAFASSCVSIAMLLALFGLGMFPKMVPSNMGEAFDLTIRNASSSQATLAVMFTIALIGMPFVIAYTIAIYWVFRGKVRVESLHY